MTRSGFLTVVYSIAALLAVCEANGFGPGEQSWGYVDVREGAHMFYWLYYTTADVPNYTQKPLTIWLQGGPGASSTGYGNFEKLGPLDLDLNPRNFTWVKDMNVLFIDNPVGSGFSYVDDEEYLTTDNNMIAKDLVALMKGFYDKHPEFKTVPLHMFCEGYGGKMAAEFALELDTAIKAGEIESNLQSVVLGGSWIAPVVSVFSWSPLLLNMGIINEDGHERIMKAATMLQDAITLREYRKALGLWTNTQVILMQQAKSVDLYNILIPKPLGFYENKTAEIAEDMIRAMHRTLVHHDGRDNRDEILELLMRGPVSEALNIPLNVTWGSQSLATFATLAEDFLKPVIHIVEKLLNSTSIEVAVYSGQLDLLCATSATVAWIKAMRWPLSKEYAAAPRDAITINGYLEGYVKKAGNLVMYWVNRSGHMVPADNPAAMDYILKAVTKYENPV